MKHKTISNILDWLISIVCYALILLLATLVFKKTLIIDNSLYGLWFLIASIIIYFLNKLVKPILVWMTLPLTGLTMGIFYPFVNVRSKGITNCLSNYIHHCCNSVGNTINCSLTNSNHVTDHNSVDLV